MTKLQPTRATHRGINHCTKSSIISKDQCVRCSRQDECSGAIIIPQNRSLSCSQKAAARKTNNCTGALIILHSQAFGLMTDRQVATNRKNEIMTNKTNKCTGAFIVSQSQAFRLRIDHYLTTDKTSAQEHVSPPSKQNSAMSALRLRTNVSNARKNAAVNGNHAQTCQTQEKCSCEWHFAHARTCQTQRRRSRKRLFACACMTHNKTYVSATLFQSTYE